MSRRYDPAAVGAMAGVITADLAVIRSRIDKDGALRKALGGDETLTTEEDIAMTSIETFVAIALRVFNTTNASKLKEAMTFVEIQARINNRPVHDEEKPA